MKLVELRRKYHQRVGEKIIRIKIDKKKMEYPNFADVGSRSSVAIANSICNNLNYTANYEGIPGQTAGKHFEELTKRFLQQSFDLLTHLRPGKWLYATDLSISKFAQYHHLAILEKIIFENGNLATALGTDYIIKPDIVIGRYPISDKEINQDSKISLVDMQFPIAQHTPLRTINSKTLLLHASISCKWTIRSDRTQDTRTEALNLIRNRKGNLPHIVAVTAEPLPTRIASLALGTGDLDCVYHFALPELEKAIIETNNADQMDLFKILVDGQRLRDISDLPFDLAI